MYASMYDYDFGAITFPFIPTRVPGGTPAPAAVVDGSGDSHLECEPGHTYNSGANLCDENLCMCDDGTEAVGAACGVF